MLDRNERGAAASRNTVETAENKDGPQGWRKSGEEKRDNTRSVNQSHAAPDNRPTTILHRSDHLSFLHYNVRPLSLSLRPLVPSSFHRLFPSFLLVAPTRILSFLYLSIFHFLSLFQPSSFNLFSPLPPLCISSNVRSLDLSRFGPRFPLSLSLSATNRSFSLYLSIYIYISSSLTLTRSDVAPADFAFKFGKFAGVGK